MGKLPKLTDKQKEQIVFEHKMKKQKEFSKWLYSRAKQRKGIFSSLPKDWEEKEKSESMKKQKKYWK